MYDKGLYENLSEKVIKKMVEDEGFNPVKIVNKAGDIYESHKHPEEKLLAILIGGMRVKVGTQTYQCRAGDRLKIPGNIEHSAVVDSDGCTFFWSEKLEN